METLNIKEEMTENMEDPRPFILGIINEISPMGANDEEVPKLYEIFNRFQKKEITAEEARSLASEIRNKKMDGDYH